MEKITIGIDPDTDKNGVAVWSVTEKKFHLISGLKFWGLINLLKHHKSWGDDLFVLIDSGHLIKKSNFHGSKGQSKQVGEKIARNVGRSEQNGILIKDFCDRENIRCEFRKPSGKWDSNYFKKVTGWQQRTNQDMRDAAKLVFGSTF